MGVDVFVCVGCRFGIALEITFLVILFVIYKMRKVWKYKSALFALAAFAT